MSKKQTRKSVKINQEDLKALKKWVKNHHTKVEAAQDLDVTRNTLERIQLLGSCSPDTYTKIKTKIA